MVETSLVYLYVCSSLLLSPRSSPRSSPLLAPLLFSLLFSLLLPVTSYTKRHRRSDDVDE